MRSVKVTLALMLVVMLAGCASINALVTDQKLTPEARYYDALQTFNSNVSQYNAIYKLSNVETKTKWKASIDPLIRAANSALDIWGQNLTAPDKEQLFRDAFKSMVTILVSSGIIKVEE